MCWAINPRGLGVSVTGHGGGATLALPLGTLFEAPTGAAGRITWVERAVEVAKEGRAMKSGLVNQVAGRS